jgi:hypothetical protein
MSTPFEIFKEMLLGAAGDALARRGYVMQDDPIPMSGGLYRFARTLEDDAAALVDVQLLLYAGGGPSRFEVKVWRTDRPSDRVKLGMWLREQGLDTLSDELGWWEFVSVPELEESLRDATRGIEGLLNEECGMKNAE